MKKKIELFVTNETKKGEVIKTQGKEVERGRVLKSNAERRGRKMAAFIEQGTVGQLLPAGLF